MTKDDAKQLGDGLYRIYWKNGDASIASVGSLHDGTKWFAPTNWVSQTERGIASVNWRVIERVERLYA